MIPFSVETWVGIGVFIHGVCICNNLDKHTHLVEVLSACFRATAGLALALRMYYYAAILLGCAEIIVGLKQARKELNL